MDQRFMTGHHFPVSFYQCVITKVHPSKMSVDVYIPQTAAKYQGVTLLSGNLGTAYGTVSLPEENSLGIVAIYHKGKFPVLLGILPGYGFNNGECSFEPIKQGENQTTGIGGGFIKLDDAGNCITGSKGGALQWLLCDGTNASVGKSMLEISNLHRNSLRIDGNNDIISLNRSFEYHRAANNDAYDENDIFVDGKIDDEVRKTILDNAYDVIQKLSSEESIFSKTASIVSAITDSRDCTEDDIKKYQEFLLSMQIKPSGGSVKGEIFGDSAVTLEVCNEDGEVVAGIVIDEEFGGKLTGQWVIEDEYTG